MKILKSTLSYTDETPRLSCVHEYRKDGCFSYVSTWHKGQCNKVLTIQNATLREFKMECELKGIFFPDHFGNISMLSWMTEDAEGNGKGRRIAHRVELTWKILDSVTLNTLSEMGICFNEKKKGNTKKNEEKAD